ncbi:hypothetical protein HPULCUR_011799 [Helicostylum pulchrum]|uniref:F-box domain-containing protein n=1 Tax=Helicostylum pulchrum TaxID=562976 RepID=A0ABP9YH41_9FUNG
MYYLRAQTYTDIFRYLKRKVLPACYLVCKSWHTAAIPLDWEEVTLGTHNISLVKSHLNKFGHYQHFKSDHLKKLAFKDYKNDGDLYKFDKLELLALFNQLPNLNEIDFSRTNYLEEYLECLLYADMQHIKTINTGQLFQRIQSDLLFSVYYKFHSSITCLCLLYDKNTINVDSQQINMLSLLTQFKKLTKLVLHNENDIDLTPFQIQENCPNLKHLAFFSQQQISENVVQHIIDVNRRIDLNFISSLTYLDLHIPSLSATYTKYLIDYLPNKLTNVVIVITRQNIFTWMDIVGMELALKFMEKIGDIQEIFFDFVRSEKYPVLGNGRKHMENYFKLHNAFRKARKNCRMADYYDPDGKMKALGFSFN